MTYTPEHLHSEQVYTPNPADDVPYPPDRPVVLQDSAGRVHDGYRSRSHENMIRILLGIGFKCVERQPDNSGWREVEYLP